MNGPPDFNHAPAEGLCLACGLCCNGVIFADVQLRPTDDPAHLRALGLKFRRSRPQSQGSRASATLKDTPDIVTKFPQPCQMFDGCRCRIYADRPEYCREFACALLKQVQAGRLAPATALAIIRTARRRVEKVTELLDILGDNEEHLPLAARFRHAAKRLEKAGFDQAAADVFGQLSLEVHDLNLLLSQEFYPGASPDDAAGVE